MILAPSISPARLLYGGSSFFRWFSSRRTQMACSFCQSPAAPDFPKLLANAAKIIVLTGAGISSESGIPTFRGEGGLWRDWDATSLATPAAFARNPSLVWEFYHYRRCIVSKCTPNAGHYALAAFERRCEKEGKEFTVLTQNIDGLHLKAGSKRVVELHGSLWKTRCSHCGDVQENLDMPICPALDGKGAPDTNTVDARIPTIELPRCKKCNGLLRPHVVWFNECLEQTIVCQADEALDACNLLLVVGTSSVVYPAASYAPLVRTSGGMVAEFNIEETPASSSSHFKYRGPASTTLPTALGISWTELLTANRSRLCLNEVGNVENSKGCAGSSSAIPFEN